MRILLRVATACLLAIASAASARSITVDDLLRLEGWGQVAFDPTGRWLIAEARGSYADAASFQGDYYARYVQSRLYRVDLRNPGPARPLLTPSAGEGHMAGPISPDGRHMLVYRLSTADWKAGVVEIETGAVRWLEGAPQFTILGRTAQWRSPTELVMITRSGEGLPVRLRLGWNAMARLPELWRRVDRGDTAVSVTGSGAFSGLREAPEAYDLVRVDIRTGARSVLASGPFVDLELSADGAHAAVVEEGELLQPGGTEVLRSGTTLQRHNVLLVNLASRNAVRPCSTCDVLIGLLAWSPTSDGLLVYSRNAMTLPPWSRGRLLQIKAGAGSAQFLPADDFTPAIDIGRDGTVTVRAGWLRATPISYGRRSGGSRDDWYAMGASGARNLTEGLKHPPATLSASSARGVLLVSDGGTWRITPNSTLERLGAVTGLRAAPEGERQEGFRLQVNGAPARNWMLAQQVSGERRSLWRIGPDIAVAQELPSGGRLVASGEHAVAMLTGDEHGVSTLTVHQPGRPAIPVLTLNAGLADIGPAQVRRLTANGVSHWIYLPADWRLGRPLPLVVVPYPGAVHTTPPAKYAPGSMTFYTNPQVLAAQGYAVLVPSLPRLAGSEPMSGLAQQILAAVDLAIAEGYADPNRLAVWGHSYGGYTAMALAGQTHRFRSIIASSGISDLTSHWSAIPPDFAVSPNLGPSSNWGQGWVEGNAGMGGPPWTAPDRYRRNSPLSFADKITTPVLLIQGDQDSIALTQAQSLFSALYREGKPAALVTYWGEGHVVSSPGNVRDLYARVVAWLDATTAGDPAAPATPGP